jgi:hypothetical protein
MSKKLLKNDLSDLFADDAENNIIIPSNDKIQELSDKVSKLADLEEKVFAAEEKLKKLNKEYTKLAQETIPDIFDELNMSEFKMKDGTIITIKRRYLASITEANKKDCFKWLNANNHGSIIKHNISANLKKGEKKEATKIVTFLKKLGVTFKDKESVHAKTLEAFVKEQIENGENFPQDTFKVFPLRQAKVKFNTF